MGIEIHEVSQNALLCYRKEDGEDPWFELQVSELFFRLKSPKELRFRISFLNLLARTIALSSILLRLIYAIVSSCPCRFRLD